MSYPAFMPEGPILSIRAGQCQVTENENGGPQQVKPLIEKGFLYLYMDVNDGFIHFAWRQRHASYANEKNLDFIMVPGDARFLPCTDSKPGGRVCLLKFTSSSGRYFFWLQYPAQAPGGDANAWSAFDLKIVDIMDRMVQSGERVEFHDELEEARRITKASNPSLGGPDNDVVMEDVNNSSGGGPHGGSGGAGPGAAGGDFREEGESSRGGGADGARAAGRSGPVEMTPEASRVVQNLLTSLESRGTGPSGGDEKMFPFLNDLFVPTDTVAAIKSLNEQEIDKLIDLLPPVIVVLSNSGNKDVAEEPSAATIEAAKASMSMSDKKQLLERVLHSPQLMQSFQSLTVAIRDGGLPTLAEALQIDVENRGYVRGGGMPLGESRAVKAFIDGVRRTVRDEKNKK